MSRAEPVEAHLPEETDRLFFTAAEAATIEALTARIVPSDDRRTGAREARVVTFIDRALAGPARELASHYRDGIAELDRACVRVHGSAFVRLDSAEQDDVLAAIDAASSAAGVAASDVPEAGVTAPDAVASAGWRPLFTFFAVVWEHTIQGMFCDPEYGGNHEMTGWRLIGFPGAQWGYRAEQMRPGFDAAVIPVRALADVRREARSRPGGRRARVGTEPA
jgi:gluconate 2-dehydrogenase gamma chain